MSSSFTCLTFNLADCRGLSQREWERIPHPLVSAPPRSLLHRRFRCCSSSALTRREPLRSQSQFVRSGSVIPRCPFALVIEQAVLARRLVPGGSHTGFTDSVPACCRNCLQRPFNVQKFQTWDQRLPHLRFYSSVSSFRLRRLFVSDPRVWCPLMSLPLMWLIRPLLHTLGGDDAYDNCSDMRKGLSRWTLLVCCTILMTWAANQNGRYSCAGSWVWKLDLCSSLGGSSTENILK